MCTRRLSQATLFKKIQVKTTNATLDMVSSNSLYFSFKGRLFEMGRNSNSA